MKKDQEAAIDFNPGIIFLPAGGKQLVFPETLKYDTAPQSSSSHYDIHLARYYKEKKTSFY